MRITALVGATALAFTLTACGQADDAPMKDSMPSSSMSDDMTTDAAPGMFGGLNGKKVAGEVTIADGKLELSGFSSDFGPDLHVYLTNGNDSAAVAAGVSVGKVVPDDASQVFELGDVDPAEYDTVVIHCDKAKAVFGAATLS